MDIFIKGKIYFTERLIEKLFTQILNSQEINEKDIVGLIYFYSKSRYRDEYYLRNIIEILQN